MELLKTKLQKEVEAPFKEVHTCTFSANIIYIIYIIFPEILLFLASKGTYVPKL